MNIVAQNYVHSMDNVKHYDVHTMNNVKYYDVHNMNNVKHSDVHSVDNVKHYDVHRMNNVKHYDVNIMINVKHYVPGKKYGNLYDTSYIYTTCHVWTATNYLITHIEDCRLCCCRVPSLFRCINDIESHAQSFQITSYTHSAWLCCCYCQLISYKLIVA